MGKLFKVTMVVERDGQGNEPLSEHDMVDTMATLGFDVTSIEVEPEGEGWDRGEDEVVLSAIPKRQEPLPRADGRRRWCIKEGKRTFDAWGPTAEDAFESVYPPIVFKVSGRFMSKVGGRERFGFTSDDGRRVLMVEVHQVSGEELGY